MVSAEQMVSGGEDRLFSLDALRGFDMLFLMGLAGVIAEFANIVFGVKDSWLALQMQHVAWDGFRQRDTIFPLFLFVAGVAWPFSFAAQRAKGRILGAIRLRVLKRAVLLFALGMVYNGVLAFDMAHFRVGSVLGQIGIAWAAAALLYTVSGVACRVAVAVSIMVGYAAVLLFVHSPVHPDASSLSFEGCFTHYLNTLLLPGVSGLADRCEAQGVLSMVSAISTALIGTLAGDFVRRKDISSARRSGLLLAAGVAFTFAAWALDGILPVNKKLWSPTFVLAAGGYSLILFSVFFWICDVRRWRAWAFPLRVVGMNSIAIYFLVRIVPVRPVVDFFFGGILSNLPKGAWPNLFVAAASLAIWWCILLFLYRKKVFFKV